MSQFWKSQLNNLSDLALVALTDSSGTVVTGTEVTGTVVTEREVDEETILLPNYSPVLDVMIDIETLGIHRNSVVLSICAVLFDRAAIANDDTLSITQSKQVRLPSTLDGMIFSTAVSTLECLKLGCTIDPGTADFWLKQGDRTQLVESMKTTVSLKQTFLALNAFLDSNNPKAHWAKSPSFDMVILKSLAEKVGVQSSLDYRKEACVRTEVRDYPMFEPYEIQKVFNVPNHKSHDPLYDCLLQIQSVQEVYAVKKSYESFSTPNTASCS